LKGNQLNKTLQIVIIVFSPEKTSKVLLRRVLPQQRLEVGVEARTVPHTALTY
jgi:hypothetical protein